MGSERRCRNRLRPAPDLPTIPPNVKTGSAGSIPARAGEPAGLAEGPSNGSYGRHSPFLEIGAQIAYFWCSRRAQRIVAWAARYTVSHRLSTLRGGDVAHPTRRRIRKIRRSARSARARPGSAARPGRWSPRGFACAAGHGGNCRVDGPRACRGVYPRTRGGTRSKRAWVELTRCSPMVFSAGVSPPVSARRRRAVRSSASSNAARTPVTGGPHMDRPQSRLASLRCRAYLRLKRRRSGRYGLDTHRLAARWPYQRSPHQTPASSSRA